MPENGTADVVIKLDGVEDLDHTLTWSLGENEVTVEVTVDDETAVYTVIVTKT